MTYYERDSFFGESKSLDYLKLFEKGFKYSGIRSVNLENSNSKAENIWNSAKNVFESGLVVNANMIYHFQSKQEVGRNLGALESLRKSVRRNVKPQTMVVPGGNAIYISSTETGITVNGLSEIKDDYGKKVILQKDSGIRKGDVILKINDIKVNIGEDILKVFSKYEDGLLKVEIMRNTETIKLELAPVKRIKDGKYELGLEFFDLGLGHITFYNPGTMVFGAVGHYIANEYGLKMRIKSAKIFEAGISSANKAAKGRSGELVIGSRGERTLGEMRINSSYGVFGKIIDENYFLDKELIPVATRKEVEDGKAFILSTVSGKGVEKFSVEIKKLKFLNIKGLVVEVTDPRLIELTGGIVQGMSGSPIIQNGQLVGAVSHTLIKDPLRGFGVFAHAMLKKSMSCKKV